jgi:hypothetical protein
VRAIDFAETENGAHAELGTCRDGSRYANQYSYDEGLDDVRGCPARAPAIKSLLTVVKKKSRAESTGRKHAAPMSIEELTQIIRWSESVCPPSQLTRPAQNAKEQFLVAKHALMRAFMTSGFTMWTRLAKSVNDTSTVTHAKCLAQKL